MIDVGTIGHRKCEVNLNKILMEIGDNNIAGFVVSTLVKFRLGLRQLKFIPDKSWRFCCMKAYYRDAKHEDIRDDTDSVGG